MKKADPRYEAYVKILGEELVPAMGCTEPVAIAYACAKARDLLGRLPDRALLQVSGNIIKNVKSVVVPNTGGGRGIPTAAAIGFVVGQANRELQVISSVTDSQREEMAWLLENCSLEVRPAEGTEVFDILVEAYAKEHCARVRITGFHTNLVLAELDGQVLESKTKQDAAPSQDMELLTVEGILDFANTADLEDVKKILDRQIAYNTAIREEGLTGKWGAAIGCTLLRCYGSDDVAVRARAAAAAGSDARMGGCELPVIINSGSGNQGMTASLPVIEYAKELDCSSEALYRALLVSNLLTVHLKRGIGRLSAYCGAVSAGCAAGAAIAYLHGGGFEEVAHTLVNSLAIVSGIICDGAKPSCAAKIASAVDAGIVGWQMYRGGQQFYAGDGIVRKGVEETIKTVSRVGREGMADTDWEILRIMTEKD
ncbi:MAG: serine dehydratase subunit alpha family protein [Lachnospiraceae bacterium]|jgi:L-cysteine desulfidase|nr:serine dehydratase subunit alpha family protein [Lachnospiraceae bacterium]MCI9134210.1 serine dehydratase subunit alpha family protein [Lachnospiraceae bacterium]